MVDANTGQGYPYLGISTSVSWGPSVGGSFTYSGQDPSAGVTVAASGSLGVSGQVGYTFGSGGFAEGGAAVPPVGAGAVLTYAWAGGQAGYSGAGGGEPFAPDKTGTVVRTPMPGSGGGGRGAPSICAPPIPCGQ